MEGSMTKFRNAALMGSFYTAFATTMIGIAAVDSEPAAGLFVTVISLAYCIIFARAQGWV